MKSFPTLPLEATGEQDAAITGFWIEYGKPMGAMLAMQPRLEGERVVLRISVLPPECAAEINDVLKKHREA